MDIAEVIPCNRNGGLLKDGPPFEGEPSLTKTSTAGKTLLNLDTEDWGEIFIGCAGGGDSMITLPVQHQAVSATKADAYTITVTGRSLQQGMLHNPSKKISASPLSEPLWQRQANCYFAKWVCKTGVC